MTGFKKGDVVLVNFIFSDETGVKHRPALVISSDTYQAGRQEIIIAAITSRTDRLLVGDSSLSDWQSAGLLFPSVATGIFRTVKQSMVVRKLGAITAVDMQLMEDQIKVALGL
jgi:mRNA interferase MazF